MIEPQTEPGARPKALVPKILLLLGISLAVSLGGYLVFKTGLYRKVLRSSALSITSLGSPLSIVIDGEEVGATPYYSEDVQGEEVEVTLVSGSFSHQVKVPLLASTLTVLSWGLGPSEAFSFGELVWLEPSSSGAPLVVISSPSVVRVKVDGVLIGLTPLSTSEVTLGEHTVTLEKDGYQPRQVRINLQEGYKLNIDGHLLLESTPTNRLVATTIDIPGVDLFNLSTGEPTLYTNPAGWAEGLGYWTHRNVGEDVLVYDFYVDYEGVLYDTRGLILDSLEDREQKFESIKVGYLGKGKEQVGEELEEVVTEAVRTLAKSVLEETVYVEILATGTGWLRARSAPGLGGEEVAKLDTGTKYTLLQEEGSWYEVALPEGKTGWVLGTYTKKTGLE